ncbi:MAG: hypothetical protein ACRDYZ_07800, partial [Acidimicrobiales bacterium]
LAVARGDAAGTEVAGGWRVRRTARRLRLEPPERVDGSPSRTRASAPGAPSGTSLGPGPR